MKTEEVSNPSVQMMPAPRKPQLWKRRGVVASSILLSMLSVGVSLAPTLLTATALRNSLLNSAIDREEFTATAKSATGGWIAPVVFHDVRMVDAEGQIEWTVKEIRTTKGLLSLMTDRVHLGEIRLVESSIQVRLNADGKWPLKCEVKPSKSELSFRIDDCSLELSVAHRAMPIVELRQLTITGNIGPDVDGQRMLNIQPVLVLDHKVISESDTQQNLALIAPLLTQSTELSGSVSVWLDEIHLPLDQNPASNLNSGETLGLDQGESVNIQIHGRAEFHALEARLKEHWTQQLTALFGQVSGTSQPDQIQVLKDSRVEFSVSKDGIAHDGMVFLLPQLAQELTVTSSGIVHLDETLELLLTVNLPKIVPAGRPFLAVLSQLTGTPMPFRVGGTVSEPHLQLPEGMNLLGDLSSRISPTQHTEEAPSLPGAVIDLMQHVGSQDQEQVKQNLPGSILNLIRAVDKQTKQKRAERKSPRK